MGVSLKNIKYKKNRKKRKPSKNITKILIKTQLTMFLIMIKRIFNDTLVVTSILCHVLKAINFKLCFKYSLCIVIIILNCELFFDLCYFNTERRRKIFLLILLIFFWIKI